MVFLTIHEVLAIHRRLIEDFGGIHGIHDSGSLESALFAGGQRVYYEQANIVVCAATSAYHLTQAHAFLDGNKRVATAVSEIFLEINGACLTATNDQLVEFFLQLASGKLSRERVEQQFSEWVIVSSKERANGQNPYR